MSRLKALRQSQNSPAAQTADSDAITPPPADQVVITPPPQQPGPIPSPPGWRFIREDGSGRVASCPVNLRSVAVYRNQVGTANHIQYRSIQESDRHSESCSINIEAYRNQIGTANHIQYRSIQESDRHNVPYSISKHTGIGSAQRTIFNIEAYRNQIGTTYHIQYRSIQELDRHSASRSTSQHTNKSQSVTHRRCNASSRAQRGGSAREGVRASEL